MKKFIKITFLLLICMLCACGDNIGEEKRKEGTVVPTVTATSLPTATPSPTITPEPTKTLTEQVSFQPDSFTFQEGRNKKTYFAATGTWSSERATYQLEASLSEEDKLACIEHTEAILELLDLEEKLTIYMMKPEKYTSVYAEEGKLYLCPQDWDSVDYVANLVLAAYGPWCNYGLAYGYANQICAELGWEYKEQESFPADLDWFLYDMTLPCFSTQYVTEENADNAKKLASYFVREFINVYGEEDFLDFLQESGNSEKTRACAKKIYDFYAELGIEYYPSEVLYAPGGEYYEFIVRNKFAFFYLPKEWQDLNSGEDNLLPVNFLHEDYMWVRDLFEVKTMQMEQYQKLFALEDYDDTVAFCFVDKVPGGWWKRSIYIREEHTSYCSSVTHVMHEYIHSLAMPDATRMSYWAVEGFAFYFEQRYAHYGNFDYDWYFDIIATSEEFCTDWETRCLRAWMEKNNKVMRAAEDWVAFVHIRTYVNGYASPNDAEGYVPGASFLNYIVTQYGEAAMIRYCCGRNGEMGTLPKPYEEFVEEWRAFLQEEYGWCEQYRLEPGEE